jgi:DNA-directed RNA polymerase specialized sigma24 family protein
VVLRHVGCFTTPEIAELLGTSPETVRTQLHRAHARLRVELDEVTPT